MYGIAAIRVIARPWDSYRSITLIDGPKKKNINKIKLEKANLYTGWVFTPVFRC